CARGLHYSDSSSFILGWHFDLW
nr:immunoglobulin heavy chain junction region [Macaca mulatta]